jgi:transposase
VPDDQEDSTTGEAVAGMILNGLGLSDRPLSLPPQFFANTPVALLWRAGVSADPCNRCKLGRSLGKVFSYGGDLLGSDIAHPVCRQAGMALRFNRLDTTSFSLTGASAPETDTQAMAILHGSAKEHRPDVQQAVLALLVSHEGGVPLVRQSWDGNASDTLVFKERCEACIAQCTARESPRSLLAAATLSTEAHAPNLVWLPFLPRIPETLQGTPQVIEQAWAWGAWQPLDETASYPRVDLCHDGIAQRWLVVASPEAGQRAKTPVAKAQAQAYAQGQQQRLHLQAQRFPSAEAAHTAVPTRTSTLHSPQVEYASVTPHIPYARTGRPTPETPIKAIRWHVHASVMPDPAKITHRQQRQACCVLGTPIPDTALSDAEVIAGSKGQSAVEGGCRCLKDPVFFVSSLCVKKPSRLQGLLMVMTLAFLVYSVAQRRMRHPLARQQETLPNQIGQPTSRPTLRWIFQLLAGINRVTLSVHGHVETLMEGLTDLRRKMLQLFGQKVCQIYRISPG